MIFTLFFTEQASIINYQQMANCDIDLYKQFFHGMLQKGINLAPSAFEIGLLSTAHTKNVLDQTLDAARQVFQTMTVNA